MGFLNTAGTLGFFSLSLKFARNDSGFSLGLTFTMRNEKGGEQTANSNDYDMRRLPDSIMRGLN